MLIDDLKYQMQGFSQKVDELQQELRRKLGIFEEVSNLLQNMATGEKKVQAWEETILEKNKTAANHMAETGTKFGEYYYNNIQRIMGDGHVSGAKEAIKSLQGSVSSVLSDVQEQINELQNWIDNLKNSINTLSSQIRSLIDN